MSINNLQNVMRVQLTNNAIISEIFELTFTSFSHNRHFTLSVFSLSLSFPLFHFIIRILSFSFISLCIFVSSWFSIFSNFESVVVVDMQNRISNISSVMIIYYLLLFFSFCVWLIKLGVWLIIDKEIQKVSERKKERRDYLLCTNWFCVLQ